MLDTTFLADRLSRITQLQSESSLLELFGQLVSELGGDGFAVAVMPDAETMNVTHQWRLNGWCEHFMAKNYVMNCPITARIRQSYKPFHWNDVRDGGLSLVEGQILDEACDYGISDGLIIPMHKSGEFRGNVFIRVPSEQVTAPDRAAWVALAVAFHSHLGKSGELGHDLPPLSAREREVLQWMAGGKTAQEIGTILSISPATVMFHYRRVADRLGTCNRTHTVVEALRRKVIAFN